MDQPHNRSLRIDWRGTEYECRASMKALMMIEERITLHGLTERLIGGGNNVPTTHLVWCLYCLLRCAGARVTDEEVMAAMRGDELPAETMLNVAKWVIAETYGVSPEPHEDDDIANEGAEPEKG